MRAFHTVDKLQKINEQLEAMWETFILQHHPPSHVRASVYQSWKRCQSFGVNPLQKQTHIVLTEDQLKDWQKQSRLFRASLPILQQLSEQICGTGHLITLCDERGRIMYLSGDKKILREAEKMNFVPGADWSEQGAGTNAIGTCLATGNPIQILSYEHYCQGCHPWVCSSAPIKDPYTGKTIGVFDLTGLADFAQPHSLGIAVVTAYAIQQRLQDTPISGRTVIHMEQKPFPISSSQKDCPPPPHQPVWNEIIGHSSALHQVLKQCQQISAADVPVLITGESGTGKEQIARAIHQSSPRGKAPFVAINCGAIPKELMASELFGYAPGTFTGGNPKGKRGKFAEAQGGTVFLDEIGEMPLELQVQLLRVLQEKEVVPLGSAQAIPLNVRIIAATHRDLRKMLQQGTFRSDLYYRLNVVELHLPPLRERGEDIDLLTRHFVNLFAHQYSKAVEGIDEEVRSLFYAYSWPGNVRELKNVLEYAVLFCHGNRIRLSDLPASFRHLITSLRKKRNSLWKNKKRQH